MIIDAAHYQGGVREAEPFELDGALARDRRSGSFSWIGLYEPEETEFGSVRDEYDLHELAVEDAVKAHQRPKLEPYDGTLFVVLKPAIYNDELEVVEFGEIHLFIDDYFAVVVRHRKSSQLVDVRRTLESDPETLRLGPGAVLHAITEHVIDNYLVVLDGLELDIAEVEADVFAESDVVPTERIYRLLRQVIGFSQATVPLTEPLDRLARETFAGIHPDLPHVGAVGSPAPAGDPDRVGVEGDAGLVERRQTHRSHTCGTPWDSQISSSSSSRTRTDRKSSPSCSIGFEAYAAAPSPCGPCVPRAATKPWGSSMPRPTQRVVRRMP